MNEPSGVPWTTRQVITWAADDFRTRGIDSPRLEAELLLCHVLRVDRIRLVVEPERPLTPEELSAYRSLILRRREREPIAYLLGRKEFYGYPFLVDSRVLVPRPETEVLVEVVLERTQGAASYGRLLDLCTGSGCIALAFSKQRPTWAITATDLSPDALAVATENALRLGCASTLELLSGDLYAPLASDQRFDVIVSNPPYIARPEIPTLMQDVRDYEPHSALDGGPDGLELLRRIVKQAPSRLNDGGLLALEVGHDQAQRVASGLGKSGFNSVEVRRDFSGIERIVSARKA